MQTKHIFTQSERSYLESLIEVLVEGAPVRPQCKKNLSEFLDNFTQPAVPAHVTANAEYFKSQCEDWDDYECDKFHSAMRSVYGDDWARALEEVGFHE